MTSCTLTTQLSYLLTNLTYITRQLIHEAAFGEDVALGSSVYHSLLPQLSAQSILAYRERVFASPNVVVAASGLPHATLTASVEKSLGALPSTPAALPPSPYLGTPTVLRTPRPHADQTHSLPCPLSFRPTCLLRRGIEGEGPRRVPVPRLPGI